MSFIKNPFRKSAAQKVQNKPVTPSPMQQQSPSQTKGNNNLGAGKSSLPNNYLDPNSVF